MDHNLFSQYLMSLPDSAFFDLYRTYLGPVQTPFKKQDLVRDLVKLLNNADFQRRIMLVLDDEDRHWLSIIGLSGSLSMARVQTLFGADLSPVDIHQRVLNLEDRLLIITDPETNELRLNPLLEEELQRTVVRITSILPDQGQSPIVPQCSINEAALFMLMAFFRFPREVFRQNGGLRKRDHDRLREIFPLLPPKGVLGSAVESITHGLITLGLVLPAGSSGNESSVDTESWRNLFTLPHTDRLSYLVAAMIISDMQSIEEAAACCRGLLGLLKPGRLYRRADLREAARFLHAANGKPYAPWVEDILRGMETLGIFKLVDDDTAVAADIGGQSPSGFGRKQSGRDREAKAAPSIIVQPSFEVTLTHSAAIPSLLPLSGLLEPVRFDVYPHFELTKERCIRSLIHEPEAARLLEKMNGNPLPQNVSMSLELWESEGHSILLYSGTVLVADEDRRHIIEHHQEISGMIQKTLAPGVYLMQGSQESVQQAFAAAGLGFLPSRTTKNRPYSNLELTPLKPSIFSLPPEPPAQLEAPIPQNEGIQDEFPPASDYLRELAARIDSEIDDEYHRELLRRRCRQKLLLLPEQIDPRYLPNERTEARGLDYLGKVRLLERILQSPSDLAEITERDRTGKPLRRLLRPTKLSPSGSDLFLTGLQIPGGDPVRIAVKKLSLVRKVRSGFNARF